MKLIDSLSSLIGAAGGPRGLAYRPFTRACCACICLLVGVAVAAVIGAILVAASR